MDPSALGSLPSLLRTHTPFVRAAGPRGGSDDGNYFQTRLINLEPKTSSGKMADERSVRLGHRPPGRNSQPWRRLHRLDGFLRARERKREKESKTQL